MSPSLSTGPADVQTILAASAIPARQIAFETELDAQAVPLDWFAADPFATAVVSGLSVMFPDGESFFVEAVRACRGAVSDETLARNVSAFVLQEAMHGRGHRAFNEMLAAQGHEAAETFEAEVRALLGFFRRNLPKTSRLAVTCALEHFTALLAEELLSNPELEGCLDESVKPMWLWHAIEETEHKAVAFDVFEANEGGYLHRNAVMILTTIFFLGMMVRGGYTFRRSRLARRSETTPAGTKPKRSLREDFVGWRRVMQFVWGKPGIFRKLVPGYLAYFRPGFHPNDRDASALVSLWRARLFGEGGPLAGRVTHLPIPPFSPPKTPPAPSPSDRQPVPPFAVQEPA